MEPRYGFDDPLFGQYPNSQVGVPTSPKTGTSEWWTQYLTNQPTNTNLQVWNQNQRLTDPTQIQSYLTQNPSVMQQLGENPQGRYALDPTGYLSALDSREYRPDPITGDMVPVNPGQYNWDPREYNPGTGPQESAIFGNYRPYEGPGGTYFGGGGTGFGDLAGGALQHYGDVLAGNEGAFGEDVSGMERLIQAGGLYITGAGLGSLFGGAGAAAEGAEAAGGAAGTGGGLGTTAATVGAGAAVEGLGDSGPIPEGPAPQPVPAPGQAPTTYTIDPITGDVVPSTSSTGSVQYGNTPMTAAQQTALQRILSGNGGASDYAQLAGQIAPSLLGYLGSRNQTEALERLNAQQMAVGAPSRARYEAGMSPGFDPTTIPGYRGALDTSMETMLRRLSAQGGNPFGNPGGLIEANKAIVAGTALPAVQNYLNQNAATGGYGAFNTAAPQTAMGVIGSQGNQYNAIGTGLESVLNPPRQQPTLAELLMLMRSGGFTGSAA